MHVSPLPGSPASSMGPLQNGSNRIGELGREILSPHTSSLELCSFYLSISLNEAVRHLSPFVHRDFSFSHALYADDFVISIKATKQSCRTLIHLLQHFLKFTGLKVNLTKSAIYFSKWATRDFNQRVCDMLGMQKE